MGLPARRAAEQSNIDRECRPTPRSPSCAHRQIDVVQRDYLRSNRHNVV
jgi:hypothetical protein